MKHSCQKSLSRRNVCIVLFFFLLFPISVSAAADTWTETDSAIYTTDPSKNVGIGTDNPLANLAVQGKRFVVGSNAMLGNYSPDDAAFEFQNPVGSVFLNFVSKDGGMVFSSSTYDGGQNGLFSWKHPFVFYMDGEEVWRIDPATRNVGIGTMAPTPHYDGASKALIVAGEGAERGIVEVWGQNGGKALLQSVEGNTYIGNVEDGTNTGAGNTYIVRGDGTRTMTISGASGTVGIGTTEPSYKLDVQDAENSLAVQVKTGAVGGYSQFRLSNPERDFVLTNNASDDLLSLYYGTDNRLQFNLSNQWFSKGNVGIGTTNPQYLLDVAGTVRSSELCLGADCRKTWPNSSWETYENFVYSGTNVGIKADPGNYALKVNGDAELGNVFASKLNAHTIQANNNGSVEFYDNSNVNLVGSIISDTQGLTLFSTGYTRFNSDVYMGGHTVGIGAEPEDSKSLVIDGNSGIGLAVRSDSASAIDATSISGSAVAAENNSSSEAAVDGYNPAGMGIAGRSQNGYGIYGFSKNSYAGYFDGAVSVVGNLRVKGGDICLGNCL